MKLLEQIEKWAIETPDQTAFVWRDAKITYKQLKEDSDALAHWISSGIQMIVHQLWCMAICNLK